MDIVNAHVHLIDLFAMMQKHSNLTLPAGISVLKDIASALPLLRPEAALEQMDEAGIARSILYAVEAPIVYASNEYVHSLVSKHPDRFLGFASVNPKSPDAPAVLERAVRDLGLRGLKLHPPLQDFFPNDEAVYPVYAKAVELNIPVVFHVGTSPFGSLCRLSQASPLLIDDVAVRFPTLRILLTHLGTLWHNEAFMVVEKNPCVFIDTAAYLNEIRQVLTPEIVSRIGPDKIIFGTDYPMPYGSRQHRMKDFVDCVSGLPLGQDVLAGILGGNVRRFLTGEGLATGGLTSAEVAAKLMELMASQA